MKTIVDCGIFQKIQKLLIEIKKMFIGPCKPKNIAKKDYASDIDKAQDIYRYLKSKKMLSYFQIYLILWTGVTMVTRGNFRNKL